MQVDEGIGRFFREFSIPFDDLITIVCVTAHRDVVENLFPHRQGLESLFLIHQTADHVTQRPFSIRHAFHPGTSKESQATTAIDADSTTADNTVTARENRDCTHGAEEAPRHRVPMKSRVARAPAR